MGRGRGGNGSNRPANSTGGKKEAYVSPSMTVKTDRSKIRDTEQGMSEKLKQAVLAVEEKYRDNKTEQVTIFDEDGNQIFHKRGGKSSVSLPMRVVKPNSIVTHNHPMQYDLSTSRFAGLESSFSDADIKTTISNNAKEIRAVTRDYVYSMKRPKGGWNVNPYEVAGYHERLWEEKKAERRRTELQMIKDGATAAEIRRYRSRSFTVGVHDVNRQIAEKYGFIYTRRRSRTKAYKD